MSTLSVAFLDVQSRETILKRSNHVIENTFDNNTAYGDESIRMAGDPPFYMLGVCSLKNACEADLNALATIMPPGAKKLHWRDMSQGLQRQSLALLANIDCFDLVVVASPLDGKKQERARRKCLEALLPLLEERGVARVVLESRGSASDKLDINYIKYAKGSRTIRTINVGHASGANEPRLWIPDQIIGAMGDYITQTGNWRYWRKEWEKINPSIERIDIPL